MIAPSNLVTQFPVGDVEQQRSFYNTEWASFKGVNTFELRRIAKVLEYLCRGYQYGMRSAI